MLKIAREHMRKAQALAAHASPREQAYIAALAKRYDEATADPMQRERAYSAAMRELSARFPDDLDAATLYAESMMNLAPWQLWTKDGKPGADTERIVEVLEGVLRRTPQHLGANHYYIHVIEASPHPERALAAADRLRAMQLSAGHLVHMPAHIYWRTGDYSSAAAVNVNAARADRRYIERTGLRNGAYAMNYYTHNLHFEALAELMAGRYAQALAAANALSAHVPWQMVKEMPQVEGFLPIKTYVLVRFSQWDQVLAQPEPDRSLHLQHGIWQWSRALALNAKGDVAGAQRLQQEFRAARASVPADALVDKTPMAAVLAVADEVLAARLAVAAKDYATAQQHYEAAARMHDEFNYTEPPEWPFPVRESLGAMLLQQGRAAEAERVFRDDLQRFPRSGRSLFGLVESLRAQGKQDAAHFVEAEFKAAWPNATPLRIGDLELGAAPQERDRSQATATAAGDR